MTALLNITTLINREAAAATGVSDPSLSIREHIMDLSILSKQLNMHSTAIKLDYKGHRQNLASASRFVQIFVANVASGDLGPLLHQSMHTSGKL